MKAKDRDNYLRMMGNDLDSVKHHCRRLHWMLNAIVAHFQIVVQPDMLDDVLNPTPTFINKIVGEARGEFAATAKRQHETERKRKWRRKKRRAKK